LYEKLFNSALFSRQRIIGTARHWEYDPLQKLNQLDYEKAPVLRKEEGIWRTLEPLTSWMLYRWPRDIMLQRGLTFEDFYLFNDRELRRDPLFEHINRQSLHPYMHLFFRRRRIRYYKVERALRGFFVPEYIRKEAEERLLPETFKNIVEWQSFAQTHWYNDMTKWMHWPTVARLIPLEVFVIYGLFDNSFYERYFFNETKPDVSKAELDQYYKEHLDPKLHYDIETDEGKREFEAEVNRLAGLYPGAFVKEGEQYNFKRFYAKQAILHNKDTSKFDSKLVEDVKAKLEAEKVDVKRQITDKGGKHEKIEVGTKYPKLLKSKNRKVLQ